MASRFTEDQLKEILEKGNARLQNDKSVSNEKLLTRKSGRVPSSRSVIDGHLFDSRTEAMIYSEFRLDPDIEILELQPQFVLLRPFKRKNKTIRGVTYTSDFKITIKGILWIIEVKSIGTLKANSKNYPMRRKLFLNRFPELNFREIIFDGKQRTEKDY